VPLRELVARRLPTVARDARLADVNRLFDEPHHHHVAVLDARGRPLGVISREELRLWPPPLPAPPLPELMSKAIIAVPASTTLAAASALMVRRKLDGVLVPLEPGYGCVVAADVVRWIASQP